MVVTVMACSEDGILQLYVDYGISNISIYRL